MAFSIPKTGYRSMFKEGTRQYQGLEEAVFRNIEACKQFSEITKSSYGPNGMKKIIVNHLEKLFVTKDAATIVKELEIEHPAAKIVVMASKMAEQEVGDGTNFVILLSAELLFGALELLTFGVAPCDLIDSYKTCLSKVLEILNSLIIREIKNYRELSSVLPVIRSVVQTKTIFYDFFAELIAKACIDATPVFCKTFNVDNIRTVKVLGSSVESSEAVLGLAVINEVAGSVKEVKDAKIVVFNTDFDLTNPETTGTVLLNSAQELLNFTPDEENLFKKSIQTLKDMGVNVVVCSGKVADHAIDFSNRMGIMIVRISSKFELMRLCRATSSSSLPNFSKPTSEQLGHCKRVYVRQIADTTLVVFEQEREESCVSTIIIRGSSESIMEDIERAIDDGVNCYKSITINPKIVPGACATEMEICSQLEKMSSEIVGFEKLAYNKFCEAFRSLARTILTNNGMRANELLTKLSSEHLEGKKFSGIDIMENSTCDVKEKEIYDLLSVKSRCIQLAVDAVSTILSVDQIIVARPAGGPVPKQNPAWDQD